MLSRVYFYLQRKDGGDNQTPVQCGDCGWKGVACDLEGIADIDQRVEPGEICPAGECPECGAMAHVIDKEGDQTMKITKRDALRIVKSVVKQADWYDYPTLAKVLQDELAAIEPKPTPKPATRERDTILAALRLWQRTHDLDKGEELLEIADNGRRGRDKRLGDEEIDDLCERINS